MGGVGVEEMELVVVVLLGLVAGWQIMPHANLP